MTCGIYKLTFSTPKGDFFYIGSSKDIENRLTWGHLGDLQADRHDNPRMQSIWNKYHNVRLSILEECSLEDLLIHEQEYLNRSLGNLFLINMNPFATCPPRTAGIVKTPEWRVKISQSLMGRKQSSESVARRRLSNIGKKRSQETKSKISTANLGKKRSIESCSKISLAKKGQHYSPEARERMKISRTPEYRAKLSSIFKGRKLLSEKLAKHDEAVRRESTRRKISNTLKEYNRKRKEAELGRKDI